MAIIYSYPLKGTPNDNDLIVISDSEATDPKLRTKQVTVASIKGATGGGTVTSVGLTMPSAFAVSGSPVTGSGTLGVTVTGGSAGQYLDYTGAWSTPPSGDTYTLQAEPKSSNSVPLKLDAASGTDSTVNLTEGANVTLTRNSATEITIAATGGGAGVSSFTNVNGTYISASTVNSAATGAVTVGTIDLSAVDGTAIAGTRFLSKDNTWDVPAYTTYNAASSSTLGLMKLASDTEQSVAANAVTSEASRTYGIQFNADDQAVVNVPWADTNTTYTGSSGILLTGTNFTNTDKGSSQNIFKTVAVSGQANIVADSNSDTLTFAAGAGVTLTTNNLTDTLTIAASSSSGALSLLKTSVFGYTGTNQASYSEFALTNSTTFAPVRFNPTSAVSAATNDVVVAITVPSTPANYIRVKTQFAVRSSSSSQELVHCAWHHASGSVTNPTYGWQTIGLDDDVTNDITVINYTTDLLVSELVDLEGESASAGSTVYLWLKANGSNTGTDMLLGRWWPSTMSSTGTSSVGPLVVEVYELVAGNRTFNPPTPE